MNTDQLLSSIDAEIARLRQVRDLLAGHDGPLPMLRTHRRRRHNMSAEARERIAAAQRKRWAKQKAGKK